ncbi:MAG: PKD domain-containing protein, partial [Flavobacteriales bacterium]
MKGFSILSKRPASLLLAGLAFFVGLRAHAQTFYNQGQVYVLSNAIVHINGNCETNGSASILENNGEITVVNSTLQGDFKIDNAGTVLGDGKYFIEGDWINNATFTPGQSYVNLNGGDQYITGTVQTSYYDLELSGTGIKTQTIDATVTDSLMLNDRELATELYTMYMTNTATGTITNDQTFGAEGFVSSLGNGALSWDMAANAVYRFPVGSSQGVKRYREVDITPNTANPNTFTVRLANNSPSLDSFFVDQLDSNLCLVNNLYYHKINHTSGTDNADVSIYYESGDGNFDALAQWNTPSATVWNDMSPVTGTTGQYNSYTAASWSDFTNDPFALALTGPVFAGFDTSNSGFFNNLYSFIDGSSGSPYTWNWDFGDGDSSSLQNPQHEYDAGTYNVV